MEFIRSKLSNSSVHVLSLSPLPLAESASSCRLPPAASPEIAPWRCCCYAAAAAAAAAGITGPGSRHASPASHCLPECFAGHGVARHPAVKAHIVGAGLRMSCRQPVRSPWLKPSQRSRSDPSAPVLNRPGGASRPGPPRRAEPAAPMSEPNPNRESRPQSPLHMRSTRHGLPPLPSQHRATYAVHTAQCTAALTEPGPRGGAVHTCGTYLLAPFTARR